MDRREISFFRAIGGELSITKIIISFIVIIMVAVGCSVETIEKKDLEIREGIAYARGSDKPFSGKAVVDDPHSRYIAFEIEYSKGLRHGTYTKFYNKMHHIPWERYGYRKGVLHGDYTHFNDVGCTWIKGGFKEGKPHGKWEKHFDCGPKMCEMRYDEGKIVDEIKRWYKDGTKEMIVTVGSDGRSGSYRYWDEEGNLVASGEVVDGVLVGFRDGETLYDIGGMGTKKPPE